MKKCFPVFALSIAVLLSSCEAHFGSQSFTVPWYVIAVPLVIFIVIAFVISGHIVASHTYVCPKCGEKFSPKWYDVMFTLHVLDEIVLKCPKCGHKGFCHKDY